MFKRILVPVGGTPVSEEVLPYAAVVAKALDLPITLVSVVAPRDAEVETLSVSPTSARGGSSAAEAEAPHRIDEHSSSTTNTAPVVAALDAMAEKLSEDGVEVGVHVRVGDPASEILRTADERAYGLIVMSSRGRGWFGRTLHGSVADEVIRASNVPVVEVGPQASGPAPGTAPSLSTMTIFLDGTEMAERAIPSAVALAKALRLTVELVRIIDTGGPYTGLLDDATFVSVLPEIKEDARSYLARVASELRADGLCPKTVVTEGSPREIVAEGARDGHDTILAMATRGLSGITRVMAGSVAEIAGKLSVGPVLVVPPGVSD